MRNQAFVLLACGVLVLGCSSESSTLRLRIAADPAVGALDALVAMARTGTGDAAHVSDPMEWNVAGRDLVADPLIAEIEIPKDSAFAGEALLVIQGRRNGVFVATAVMQTGLDATGTVDLLLVPLAPTCDADGDGFRDCTKQGCCNDDENDGFADCDDSQAGATPFANKPECRCPDGAAIGTAACLEGGAEPDAEIVEPGETVVVPDPGAHDPGSYDLDVPLSDGQDVTDIGPDATNDHHEASPEPLDVSEGPDHVDADAAENVDDVDALDTCQPGCTWKVCGGDGCGGSCGTCDEGRTCDENGLCAVVLPGLFWVTLPSGSFQMGSPGSTSEQPVHSVSVPPFQVARAEVTQAQYAACTASGCTAPSCEWDPTSKGDHPVVCVDWNASKAFCTWVGARLCSEAEWEYAARSAMNEWDYPWGDAAPDCTANNKAVMGGCSCSGPCSVCSKTAGNSSQGVCDLAGNVWEWVEDDWHADYDVNDDGWQDAPADGSAWVDDPRGNDRVMRGGGCGDAAGELRASVRFGAHPVDGLDALGLRCCRSLGACQPYCDGKQCGGDGCGGSCGECTNGKNCTAGECVCVSTTDSDCDGDPDATDCAPSNPDIRHGAQEICNGVDDDCDDLTDEDYVPDTSCFRPGACSTGNAASSCGAGVETGCNTGTASTEVCNGLDDDCDGSTDEGGAAICDDGNACNGVSTCQSGTCAQTIPPVICTASDACHEVATCSPATGECGALPLPDGTPCDDGNPETLFDHCDDGVCLPCKHLVDGTVEIPDDGIDQDCDGVDVVNRDEAGYYVDLGFLPGGTADCAADVARGSRACPFVTLLDALGAALQGQDWEGPGPLRTEIYVAAGLYSDPGSVVEFDRPIQLLGGYTRTEQGPWNREPGEHPTILYSTGGGSTVIVGATAGKWGVLDGLVISPTITVIGNLIVRRVRPYEDVAPDLVVKSGNVQARLFLLESKISEVTGTDGWSLVENQVTGSIHGGDGENGGGDNWTLEKNNIGGSVGAPWYSAAWYLDGNTVAGNLDVGWWSDGWTLTNNQIAGAIVGTDHAGWLLDGNVVEQGIDGQRLGGWTLTNNVIGNGIVGYDFMANWQVVENTISGGIHISDNWMDESANWSLLRNAIHGGVEVQGNGWTLTANDIEGGIDGYGSFTLVNNTVFVTEGPQAILMRASDWRLVNNLIVWGGSDTVRSAVAEEGANADPVMLRGNGIIGFGGENGVIYMNEGNTPIFNVQSLNTMVELPVCARGSNFAEDLEAAALASTDPIDLAFLVPLPNSPLVDKGVVFPCICGEIEIDAHTQDIADQSFPCGSAPDIGCHEYCSDPPAADYDGDNDGDPDATDCAPADSAIHHGAVEFCNGVDDDCDGQTDETFSNVDGDALADCVDPDIDNDSILNELDNCPSVYNPSQVNTDKPADNLGDACDTDDDQDAVLDVADNCPLVANSDQDDLDHDAVGDACDPDIDNDGELNETDCDDFNPKVNHFQDEVCDGIDNNCDDWADSDPNLPWCDTYYYDSDQDGFGNNATQCLCQPMALFRATIGGDCNDNDIAVYPGATETCNGVDDNCNNQTDEGSGLCSAGQACVAGSCVTSGFVKIPTGSFWMGSPDGTCPAGYTGSCGPELGREADETLHYVTLTREFEIMNREVTQKEWRDVALAMGWGSSPSYFSACGDNCPVERIDWYEALAYANAKSAQAGLAECYNLTACTGTIGAGCPEYLCYGYACTASLKNGYVRPQDCPGYRLPIEAEWEYAYRAGSNSAFYPSAGNDGTNSRIDCGVDANLDKIAWYCGNASNTTHVAGAGGGKTANAWGLYGMAGNVWEWCWDSGKPYAAGTIVQPVVDPWTDGSNRTLRGGAWDVHAGGSRAADRSGDNSPAFRNPPIGFRLVRSLGL